MSGAYRRMIEAACELATMDERAPRALRPYREGYRALHRHVEVGQRQGRMLIFEPLARQVVRHWLAGEGVDPAVGLPEAATSRAGVSAHQRDEKAGAAAIATSQSLVAWSAVGDVHVNGERVHAPKATALVTPAERLHQVSAHWLLTVENYETFLTLCAEPNKLRRDGPALLVFRSSPSFPAGMRWATEISAAQGLPHWHAGDVDPQGLSHCLDRPLTGAWLPSIEALRAGGAPANRALYDRQQSVAEGLRARAAAAFPALVPWVDWVLKNEAGLTQESAFANKVPFDWVANSATDRVGE